MGRGWVGTKDPPPYFWVEKLKKRRIRVIRDSGRAQFQDIVIVITTYHAVYWSYRASSTDRWFLPCSIPWVSGLPEVAHSTTEDPEDRGYQPAKLWGQWQLHSFSISNGDGRWPVGPPGVKGQGRAIRRHSTKHKARVPPTGAMQQSSNKATRMQRSKNWPLFGVHFCHPQDAHRLGPCAFRSRQRTCTSPMTHS